MPRSIYFNIYSHIGIHTLYLKPINIKITINKISSFPKRLRELKNITKTLPYSHNNKHKTIFTNTIGKEEQFHFF
jgi:uncharacterized protein YerC